MDLVTSIKAYCQVGAGVETLQYCLQGIYNIGVALAVALAFLYIIYGAVEYLVGAATNQQAAGKEKIINALIGIFIIFISGTVLYWINPQIFNAKLLLFRVTELKAPRFELSSAEQTAIINEEAGWNKNEPLLMDKVVRTRGTSTSIGKLNLSPCDESVLTTVTVFGGKSVQVHKGVAASLKRVSAAWEKEGGVNFYKIKSLGGYDCRTIKTPEGRDTGRYSPHAYGLAVDINCLQNPFLRNTCLTDMPKAFRDLFIKEGWGWGGNWNSSKDPMHFSKLPNEGGDGKLEL